MTDEEAQVFARNWVTAWNAHDVEEVLRHFSDDALFTSPIAATVVPDSGGVIRGKSSLRSYWTNALRLNPKLHFDLVGIDVGVDTIVIRFRTQDGVERCEVLTFEAGLVTIGHGTFRAPAQDCHRWRRGRPHIDHARPAVEEPASHLPKPVL